jgi:hypothetical protein
MRANQNSLSELGIYPEIDQMPSLLTRSRPHSYSKVIGLRNQVRDYNGNIERY